MDKYVETIRNGLIESLLFFGNKKKQERELWVLREFLCYLPIQVVASEVMPSNQEPYDVFYRQQGFQVKEVLSPGRRRGKEYWDKLKAICGHTTLEDLLEPYIARQVHLDEDLPRVASELERHRTEKYNNETSTMDVLVYLNLLDTNYTDEAVTEIPDEMAKWRSVSLVSNSCAIVLSCNDLSDQFLYPLVGKLHVTK